MNFYDLAGSALLLEMAKTTGIVSMAKMVFDDPSKLATIIKIDKKINEIRKTDSGAKISAGSYAVNQKYIEAFNQAGLFTPEHVQRINNMFAESEDIQGKYVLKPSTTGPGYKVAGNLTKVVPSWTILFYFLTNDFDSTVIALEEALDGKPSSIDTSNRKEVMDRVRTTNPLINTFRSTAAEFKQKKVSLQQYVDAFRAYAGDYTVQLQKAYTGQFDVSTKSVFFVTEDEANRIEMSVSLPNKNITAADIEKEFNGKSISDIWQAHVTNSGSVYKSDIVFEIYDKNMQETEGYTYPAVRSVAIKGNDSKKMSFESVKRKVITKPRATGKSTSMMDVYLTELTSRDVGDRFKESYVTTRELLKPKTSYQLDEHMRNGFI